MNPGQRLKNAGAGFLKGAGTGAIMAGLIVGGLVFLGPVALSGLGVLLAPLLAKLTVASALGAFAGTILSAGAAALTMGGLAMLVGAPIGAGVGALAGGFKDPDGPATQKKQDIAVSRHAQPDEAPEKEAAPSHAPSGPESESPAQRPQGSAVERYATSRRNVPATGVAAAR